MVDTFAKLRGEREGVEWSSDVVNLRMSSSSGRRWPFWRAVAGDVIAVELGIQPSMLRYWRDRSGGRNAGPALRPNTPAAAPHSVPDPAAEVSRLRRENDRLRMERDILKKTVAIFSEPPK